MRLPQWLLGLSGLLTLAVFASVAARRIRLPLTVLLAFVGLLASGLGRGVGWDFPVDGEGFEQTVVYAFLPVLVFAAVLGMSVRSFMRNLSPIVGLAVVGLLGATALVGAGVHLILGIPLAAALLFGALISATDPVAVVAVFRAVGVPQRLLTLVEGESLLNDGVAIVMFEILLAAAIGEAVDVGAGIVTFVRVFAGGAVLGAAVGFLGALALPWLDRLSAAAMSLGIAYGTFILAADIFGFSGVMATVAAALVLGGFAPSRASDEVREMWDHLWDGLDYVANGILFLLVGLAMDVTLLTRYAGAIALAIVLVLVARAAAVIPVVSLLERTHVIPRVGRRNVAVLVWGGLRGGVALALALALPETFEYRDLFIAMTAGVVLATLLLNATTISWLVHRLGLDRPTRTDRLLADTARLSAIAAAQDRLAELAVDDPTVAERLEATLERARREYAALEISTDEQENAIIRRGLHVERQTYQHLSDVGLLPPPVTRDLLREVDDKIESVTAGNLDVRAIAQRPRPAIARLGQRISASLPTPPGEEPETLAYAEATARRVAAQRTADALELFTAVPQIERRVVDHAKELFRDLEQDAIDELDHLRDGSGHRPQHAQADALAKVAAEDALHDLADTGLLPRTMVAQVADEIGGAPQED